MREQANGKLYELEERVFGDVMDAVRAASAPATVKRGWTDAAMAVLVDAQEAAGRDTLDAIAATARLDALMAEIVRERG